MQIPFKPSLELYPFESKWFESTVGKVHYIDEGTGQIILFLHGNPTWSFLHRNIIKKLRGNFRCIAMDYPGFGLSEHPKIYGYTPEEQALVVWSLVKHLDLKNYIIMAQDWGGPIGMATALQDPDRVRGFVFGNTWFWPGHNLTNTIFSVVMSSSYMQKKIVNNNFFIEKIIPLGSYRKLSSLEMDHYRMVKPTPESRIGNAEFPIQIRESRRWLRKINEGVIKHLAEKPLLLIWGMKDIALSPALIPRWQKTFRDNVLVKLPNAKHYIQEDAPNEIAQAIIHRFGEV